MSIWTQPLTMLRDPESDKVTKTLAAQIPTFSPGLGYPVNVPDDNTESVKVTLQHDGVGHPRPAQLGLQAALDSFPLRIPLDAQVSGTKDRTLIVRDGELEFELWHFEWGTDGNAFADWGGITPIYSGFSGVFDRECCIGYSNDPRHPTLWGVAASSLAIEPGLLHPQELINGNISHALSMQVGHLLCSRYFGAPALRTDCWSYAGSAIRYGDRFRLDEDFIIETNIEHPYARTVARALQEWGAWVSDAVPASFDFKLEKTPQWASIMPTVLDRHHFWSALTPIWQHLVLEPRQ